MQPNRAQALYWIPTGTDAQRLAMLTQDFPGFIPAAGAPALTATQVMNTLTGLVASQPNTWVSSYDIPGWTPPAPPTIAGLPPVTTVQEGTPFAIPLAGTGTGPFSYTVAGTLPPGVAYNAAGSTIGGTPTAQGAFTADVTITDALGQPYTERIFLNVTAPVAAPATGTAAGAATVVPIVGNRPRMWSYNPMVARADRPWLEQQATAWGVADAGLRPNEDALRSDIYGYTRNLRPWQRTPYDVPPLTVAPGAPAAQPNTVWLRYILGTALVGIAVVAFIAFAVVALGFAWEHSPWSDDDTVLVRDPNPGTDKGNPNPGTDKGNPNPGTGGNSGGNASFPAWKAPAAPTSLGDPPVKSYILDEAPHNVWIHRLFDKNANKAPLWGGADSWRHTIALGPKSNGYWHNNKAPGQLVFRATETHVNWCLGIMTSTTWDGQDLKKQFAADENPSLPTQVSIKTIPNSPTFVTTASGKQVTQNTSDAGDITIVLPEQGIVTVCVDFDTNAPTDESTAIFGVMTRTADINTVHGEQ